MFKSTELEFLICLFKILATNEANEMKLVCYLSYFFNKRPGVANLTIDSIDPFLCDVIIYSLAKIDDSTYEKIIPFQETDTGWLFCSI